MRLLASIGLILGLAACDPMWAYHLAPDAAPTPQTADSPVKIALADAYVFGCCLHTTVAITNTSPSDTVTITSVALAVTDAKNEPLELDRSRPCGAAGDSLPLLPLSLPPSGRCEASSGFWVNATRFLGANKRLKALTLTVKLRTPEGLLGATFPLRWD